MTLVEETVIDRSGFLLGSYFHLIKVLSGSGVIYLFVTFAECPQRFVNWSLFCEGDSALA